MQGNFVSMLSATVIMDRVSAAQLGTLCSMAAQRNAQHFNACIPNSELPEGLYDACSDALCTLAAGNSWAS